MRILMVLLVSGLGLAGPMAATASAADDAGDVLDAVAPPTCDALTCGPLGPVAELAGDEATDPDELPHVWCESLECGPTGTLIGLAHDVAPWAVPLLP